MPTETAPAKVNLYLHVLGRRPDGYHLLDSLAVFAGVGDRLSAEPAETLTLELTGPGAAALHADATENLVLRAASGLAAASGVQSGARLVLEKHLPVASGIGGGSADAAAALRLLVRLWGLSLPPAQLASVAQAVGADVPVCLAGRPARMTGVGEVLRAAPALPEFGLLLVNPGAPVATPDVFRARTGGFSAPAALPERWADAPAMAVGLRALGNDLEAPAIGLCPQVGAVLAVLRALPDCLLARISGSGATCFGLFPSAAAAEATVPLVSRPGWWAWGGAPHAVEAVRAAA